MPKKRKKMEYKKDCCSFCDPDTDGYWFTQMGKDEAENNKYEGFTIGTEGDDFVIIHEDECTDIMKINFCPVCGRSLKVVYKLNEMKEDFEKETDNA